MLTKEVLVLKTIGLSSEGKGFKASIFFVVEQLQLIITSKSNVREDFRENIVNCNFDAK
jgi:hypothetical protein